MTSADDIEPVWSPEPSHDAACPLCHRPNGCALVATPAPDDTGAAGTIWRCRGGEEGDISCWCRFVEMPGSLLARVPVGSGACVCHGCVARERRAMPWTPPARADEFHVLADGRRVFTARYHLRRGYCCGSGCRHCPFDEAGRPRLDVLRELGASAP